MRNRILCVVIYCGLIASASAQSTYNHYTFNFGGGPGIGRGDVANFSGNTFQATVGGGMNINRLFGVTAEYMYYDLSLRPTVSQRDGLPNASGHFQSISLNGIVNVPRHLGKWGAYGIAGVGYDDRSVSIQHSYPLQSGAVCQPPYYLWWGIYCVQSAFGGPLTVSGPQTLGSYSRTAGSYNFGGGITYQLESWRRAKIYVEYRRHEAYQADAKTIVWPISIGLRW